jgi:hypothetical protein
VCCCFPGPEAEGDDAQPPATPDNVQKVRHCCGLHVTVIGFAAHTSRNHCRWPTAGHAQVQVCPRTLTVTATLAGNGFAAHTNRFLVAARRTRTAEGRVWPRILTVTTQRPLPVAAQGMDLPRVLQTVTIAGGWQSEEMVWPRTLTVTIAGGRAGNGFAARTISNHCRWLAV